MWNDCIIPLQETDLKPSHNKHFYPLGEKKKKVGSLTHFPTRGKNKTERKKNDDRKQIQTVQNSTFCPLASLAAPSLRASSLKRALQVPCSQRTEELPSPQ
jgi:hypothetical protein